MNENINESKRSTEMSFIILIVLISETLKDYNDSILIYWYQWFMPNLTSHVAKPGNGDVWDYVIVKKLPYFTIMIVVICLYKIILSVRKEDYSDCDTYRKIFSKFINDDMRYYFFIASSVLLGQQIYYQIRYKIGFPFIYGPMFIVIPAVYLLYYLYQTNLKKRIL